MTKDIELTEKELVLLLNQQNPIAFNYLYDHYAPLIYGLIVREVKNDQLASEILKTTFINIFKDCKQLNCIKHSLFTWLLSLTTKTALSSFQINIDTRSVFANCLPRSVAYKNAYGPAGSECSFNSEV